MLGEVVSTDDVHDPIRAQPIVPQQKVFISFGGHDDDTRPGFISYLQAGLERSGINFYINIENMTKGYDIEELITNVRESRIALVIFTESYLSSAWCLEELVEINKCMMTGLTVIPIFYKVEPEYVLNGELGEIYKQLVSNWELRTLGSTDGIMLLSQLEKG
ncbi:transmembrane receptor [Raphanus sativus]|nr:transmembrane receptor [Raphanus sativus]